MRFDAAIIGGGAAGNMTAWLLARRGYKIVVLEKKGSIGKEVCGGLVTHRVLEMSKTEAVLNEIKGAYVYFPDGREICIGGDKTHAYVIDRQKFDSELAEKAMAEGAVYKLKFAVKKISDNRIEGKEDIKFDYLIGADGALSKVAKQFDMGGIGYINAVQGEAKIHADENFVRVYINKSIAPGFFSWIIPDGEKARIGLGSSEKGLKKKIDDFAKMLKAEIKNVKGGIIPVGMRKFFRDNVALIGDAAGQVKATSGGGIYASLLAANILAENFPDFKKYEEEFMKKFGREIKKTILARKIFLKLGNEDFNYIANYIEKEIEIINKYGDIDYQAKVAKEVVKRHPAIAVYLLKKIIWP